MVYTKKWPRRISENSNCLTIKYDKVNEKPVTTRSINNITHLGTALEKDKNFFMLLIKCVYNVDSVNRISQELNGTTMSDIQ